MNDISKLWQAISDLKGDWNNIEYNRDSEWGYLAFSRGRYWICMKNSPMYDSDDYICSKDEFEDEINRMAEFKFEKGMRFRLNRVWSGNHKEGDIVELSGGGMSGFFCDDYYRITLEHLREGAVDLLPNIAPEEVPKRPHADLIKQWADDPDSVVEIFSNGGNWYPVSNPVWEPSRQYRVIYGETLKAREELDNKISKLEEELESLNLERNQLMGDLE